MDGVVVLDATCLLDYGKPWGIIASHSGSRLSSPSCFYGLKYRLSLSSLRLHTRANGFGPAAYGVFHRLLSGIQTVADKSPAIRRLDGSCNFANV